MIIADNFETKNHNRKRKNQRIPLLTKKQCKQGHMPMKLEDLDAIQTIYTMVQEVCNDSERHNDDRCQ